jgi:UDP-GlcNAc3NAcA epimerase
MCDVAMFYRDQARQQSDVMERFGLRVGEFALATCHRAENTDDPNRMREICLGLADVATMLPVVFSVHPRTRTAIEDHRLTSCLASVTMVEPLCFLDMLKLQQTAKVIITDSGGMQKEAFFCGVPCITVRDETEWVETVASGWNRLAGASRGGILSAYNSLADRSVKKADSPFGDGFASNQIVSILSARSQIRD